MSYILDALKKLDKEKNYRTSGVNRISGELLKGEPPARSTGFGAGKIAAIAVVVALVTFGVSYGLFRYGKGTKPSAPLSSPTANLAVTPAARPILPSQPQPQAPVTPAMPALPAVPERQILPRQSLPSNDNDRERELRQDRSTVQKATNSLQTKVPAPVLSPPPADIKVSGIAWQDERPHRRAVINGMLVQEGAVIAGAKITEIYQDRVRFSQQGKLFEVPMLSAGGPGSAR